MLYCSIAAGLDTIPRYKDTYVVFSRGDKHLQPRTLLWHVLAQSPRTTTTLQQDQSPGLTALGCFQALDELYSIIRSPERGMQLEAYVPAKPRICDHRATGKLNSIVKMLACI